MIRVFNQASTKAQLFVGNEDLLNNFHQNKQTKQYTFIRSQKNAILLKVDNVLFEIQPQQIVSLTPFQKVEYISGANALIYQFNKEFYCVRDHEKEVNCMGVLLFSTTTIPTLKLNKSEVTKYDFLHDEILQEFLHEDSIQAEMLQLLIKNFIIKSTRLLKKQNSQISAPKQDLLHQFNLLVEEYYNQEHQVSFYAEKLYKSPKTLSNQFHKLNTNPLQIIHNRIILETKRLLQYSDHSFKEIAYQLGYTDPSGLSRLFKKQTKISPSFFRNNYSK